MNLNKLYHRILTLSYKHKRSHIGSCLSAVGIIARIYEDHPGDVFVLSSGHAGLALYVVLEQVYGHDAEELLLLHGTHPSRDVEHHIEFSSGSLGHGIGSACGIALSDPTHPVHVLVSDGELYEGSCWEALRFITEKRMHNIVVHINANGYGAYRNIDPSALYYNFRPCLQTIIHNTGGIAYRFGLHGQDAHYHVLTEAEYEAAIRGLES